MRNVVLMWFVFAIVMLGTGCSKAEDYVVTKEEALRVCGMMQVIAYSTIRRVQLGQTKPEALSNQREVLDKFESHFPRLEFELYHETITFMTDVYYDIADLLGDTTNGQAKASAKRVYDHCMKAAREES